MIGAVEQVAAFKTIRGAENAVVEWDRSWFTQGVKHRVVVAPGEEYRFLVVRDAAPDSRRLLWLDEHGDAPGMTWVRHVDPASAWHGSRYPTSDDGHSAWVYLSTAGWHVERDGKQAHVAATAEEAMRWADAHVRPGTEFAGWRTSDHGPIAHFTDIEEGA